MDLNKVRELKDIGFKIVPTCGLCKHSAIGPMVSFGTCSIQTYQHLKHTGPARQLSIHRSGWCPEFTIAPRALPDLGAFMEFMRN